jgi:hypothetical protein
MVRVFAALAAIAFLAQISFASAGEFGTKDEAVAMVKRVEGLFAKAGADSTFKAVSGSGWVNYKWPNPLNNKIEDKVSYVEKMGDYFVGVGVYR